MKRFLLPVLGLLVIAAGYFFYVDNQKALAVKTPEILQVAEQTNDANKPAEIINPNTSKGVSRPQGAFMLQPRMPIVESALQVITKFKTNAQNGDGEAAYMLSQVLFACQLQIQQSGGLNEIDCSGVTSEQIAEAEHFLKLAAEKGVTEAQLSYPTLASLRFKKAEDIAKNMKAFEQYRTDSMRYLSAAASSGNVDAMLGISNAYKEGTITEENKIRAYAYMYAANLSGLSRTPTIALARLSTEMTPAEIQQASSLGKSIYTKCCN